MTDYGPRHQPRTRTLDQIRAAADRAEGASSAPAASAISDKGGPVDRGGVYSITTLAEMTGYHRDTISDWTRHKETPLPVASGGQPRGRVPHPAPAPHRVARGTGPRRGAKGPVEGAFSFMGIKDAYKAIMARDKFVRMGESERALVHRAPMQAATQRAFGLVRQAVMAIPDRLARDMAGFPSDRVAAWRREARGYCQEALANAASAIRDMAEAVAGDIEAVGDDRAT